MLKETIYTIPINDVFSMDTECPLCEFIKKEENDAVDYSLGASMMEPDARVLSNELGYCQRHTQMMYSYGNKLSHALVMETRLKYLCEQVKYIKDSVKIPKKITIGRDKNKEALSEMLVSSKSCLICAKLDKIYTRFIDNLFYMYKTDEEFRNKFSSSKGFCIKHFEDLAIGAAKNLNSFEYADFIIGLCDLEEKNLKRVCDDVEWFAKKFDYRYKDADWKNSKDAVPRGCLKISGYIDNEEN